MARSLPYLGLQFLLGDLISRSEAEHINRKSLRKALSSVIGRKDAKCIVFMLTKQPDREVREILTDYRSAVLAGLAKQYLAIVQNKEIRFLRRPEILRGYRIEGNLYLAINEREFITATNGQIIRTEIGSFQEMPLPKRETKIDETCQEWLLETKELNQYLEQNWAKVPPEPQKTMFQDMLLNLLYYDEDNTWMSTEPKVSVGRVHVQRGRIVD